MADVQAVNRARAQAVLSDGQTVPVGAWLDPDGECAPPDAVAAVAGPDDDGRWHAIDLTKFMRPPEQ